MSPSVLLSTPLPTGSISIGHLITDPSQDDIQSFGSSESTSFDTLRTDSAAHNFLISSTLQHRKVYFATTIQSSPSKFSTCTPSATTSASEPFTRPDSAVDLDADIKADQSISALQLLPVRCRIGFSSEPHTVDDVEYSWTYHKLNDKGLQLSIGLGKAVNKLGEEEKEAVSENGPDMYWDYGSYEEEGLGGF
jgi:hypothetical protein